MPLKALEEEAADEADLCSNDGALDHAHAHSHAHAAAVAVETRQKATVGKGGEKNPKAWQDNESRWWQFELSLFSDNIMLGCVLDCVSVHLELGNVCLGRL